MDFVKVDNYQDKFAFMLLERIEQLEKTITTLESQLSEVKEASKKYIPDSDTHLEIFGYTTTFLYFKFPIKYYFVTQDSQKNIITDVLKVLIKCFPRKVMSIDVFLYTTYYIQFNLSFASPVFISDSLPQLHQGLRVFADKPELHDFTLPDVILSRYICTVQEDGDFSVLLTNYMYDINN